MARAPLNAIAGAQLQQHVDAVAELPGTTQPEIPQPPDFEALDERFGDEVRDDQWSSEVDEYLKQTTIAAGFDPSVVESTECAATLCRIRLRFEDVSAALAFQEAAQSPGFKVEATSLPTEGHMGVVVYLARSGEEG